MPVQGLPLASAGVATRPAATKPAALPQEIGIDAAAASGRIADMTDVFVALGIAAWMAFGVFAWTLDMKLVRGPQDGMDYMHFVVCAALGPLILAVVLISAAMDD